MTVVLLAFVAAFVPALLWLVFIYRRDRYEPEPKSLIARLFLWGLAAGPWASGMNILIAHLFAPSIDSAQREGAFFIAAILLFALVALSALNEEVMKYVVVSSRVRDDPAFNEPVDGMIYMSTAAIGFSAGENVVYILNTYFGLIGDSTRPGVPLALINAFLVTAPLRALLSTIGHITWSGITGWFLSRHHLEGGSGRMLVGGILLAASFHTAFNLPLFLQELGLAVGWITWLVWIAGIERYLTLLGRALLASPFRRAALRAKGDDAERSEVLRAYRTLSRAPAAGDDRARGPRSRFRRRRGAPGSATGSPVHLGLPLRTRGDRLQPIQLALPRLRSASQWNGSEGVHALPRFVHIGG